jgi:hypothetical protein
MARLVLYPPDLGELPEPRDFIRDAGTLQEVEEMLAHMPGCYIVTPAVGTKYRIYKVPPAAAEAYMADTMGTGWRDFTDKPERS